MKRIYKLSSVLLSMTLLTSCIDYGYLNETRSDLIHQGMLNVMRYERERIRVLFSNAKNTLDPIINSFTNFELQTVNGLNISDVQLIEDGKFDYHKYPGIRYEIDIVCESTGIISIPNFLIYISSIVQYDKETEKYYFILAYTGLDDFTNFNPTLDISLTYKELEFSYIDNDNITHTYIPDSSRKIM